MTTTTTEIESIERDGWAALSGGDGAAFYEAVMADDGLMVFPGAVLDKPTSVRAMRSATPWLSFHLEDVRVVVSATGTAVIVYHATARRQGDPYRAIMSSTYVKTDGAWRLVVHQQTPDPA